MGARSAPNARSKRNGGHVGIKLRLHAITLPALAVLAAATALPAPAHEHHRHFPGAPGCQTARCAWHVWRWWADTHRPPVERQEAGQNGPWQYEGTATYYSPGSCDSTGGGETAADGTHVYFGMVANSVLSLGTDIEVSPPIMGQTRFTVHDRFGSQQEAGRLDVWLPCGESIPNPWERFRIVG